MLGNFSSKNRPDFVHLNFGYRVTPKDVVSTELKTWKYAWPLEIPYGDSFEAPNEKYQDMFAPSVLLLLIKDFYGKELMRLFMHLTQGRHILMIMTKRFKMAINCL